MGLFGKILVRRTQSMPVIPTSEDFMPRGILRTETTPSGSIASSACSSEPNSDDDEGVDIGLMQAAEGVHRRTISTGSSGSNKRLTFTDDVTVCATHTKKKYERKQVRQRLSMEEVQDIRQELKQYKMTEMQVHPESTQNTHIFRSVR